jgi:diaminopimelate decarboxylase
MGVDEYFYYKDNELYCEGVEVKRIAESVETPFYLYSKKGIIDHYRDIDNAFKQIPHLVCYALKANSNLNICRILANEGSGADIVSGGELYKAIHLGINPQKIVFDGVGKTEDEIVYGIKEGILLFNVESEEEIKKINKIAKRFKKTVPIGLRINPDVYADVHPYDATGIGISKFGILLKDAVNVYERVKNLNNIKIIGLHAHIGSQITKLEPFIKSVSKLVSLSEKIKGIEYIDIGGGLGISYNDEKVPTYKDLAKLIIPPLEKLNVTVIIEPGRTIVGCSGVLVTKVLYLKKMKGKNFVVVDAGMSDFLRPGLYNASHQIVPIKKGQGREIIADIVGPICESGDFLGENVKIRKPEPDSFIAVKNTGAYGFSMASNYNSRPRSSEIIVDKEKFFIVRERETYKDLLSKEKIIKEL